MKNVKHTNLGFTLIELLVSMAVALIILGVVLLSYRLFENNLAMKAAARDIAESVRQAQTQGISIKKMASEADFNTGYGVSFNLSDPTSYYIFADKNGNGECDGSIADPTNCAAGAEHLEKDTLPNGVSVSSFCGIDSSGTVICPPAGAQTLSFVFVSPNQEKPLDATVKFTDGAGNAISGSYTAAEINLGIPGQVSITEPQSQILISNTGMVYVNPQLVVPATNHPPVVTLNGSSQMTISLGSSFSDPGATATDQEDGNLTSQISVSGSVNTVVAGTYTLTYDVADSGGLSAKTTRNVVVIANVTPHIDYMSWSPIYSGYDIGIVGSGFTPTGNTVTISNGGISSNVTSSIVSSTQQWISIAVPDSNYMGSPLTAGTYSLTVTNANGTSNSSSFYICPGPTIMSVSPASGPAGSSVTINGSGFLASYSWFASSGNIVNFQSVSNGSENSGWFSSSDGTTYYPSGTIIPYTIPWVGPGNYNISITTTYGVSNSVPFTVTP